MRCIFPRTFLYQSQDDAGRQGALTALGRTAALVLLTILLTNMIPTDGFAAGRADEFFTLTQHVAKRVAEEKGRFHVASFCTDWYYKELRKKPAPSPVEPISWSTQSSPLLRPMAAAPDPSECARRYPKGLEDARLEYAQAQTSLSLSLTFYELALVADGDDDQTYNSQELADLLEALVLPAVAAQLDAGAALKAKFDTWYGNRDLEQIMNGMGRLYDHGYRLSAADRASLNRVME